MKADYHIHTHYSDDSNDQMEEVVKDAIDLHLQEICFTDHVDYGIKLDWDSGETIQYRHGMAIANVNYPLYVEEIEHLKEKYKDRITIKLGLEFGIQTHTIPKYNELFNKYPFDFIILSVHQVEDKEFWTQDFQKDRSQKEYNERYYQEILDVIQQYKNYSVLGHLDLIVRYDRQGVYPFEKLKPILTEILTTVIKDGKGIEINTSSHRYGLNDLTPSKDILRLYKDLGGHIITIGSDTHKKEHLAERIQETKDILIELGYEEYCTYDHMNPIFHSLKD